MIGKSVLYRVFEGVWKSWSEHLQAYHDTSNDDHPVHSL